jgi:hypothetical protein
MRTHPFTSADGRRVRVVEREDGSYHLEGCDGLQYLGPGDITGPEILKLSEQGRALWNAMRDLVDAIPQETFAADPPLRSWADRAENVLEDTAPHLRPQ